MARCPLGNRQLRVDVPTSTGPNATTPFSIVTTAATPAGTTIFRIRETPQASCQNGAQTRETSDLSLVVQKRVGTVTVGSQTGTATFGAAGSVTYAVTVVTKLGSGAASFTLSGSGLPVDVSASFAPSTLTYTAAKRRRPRR